MSISNQLLLKIKYNIFFCRIASLNGNHEIADLLLNTRGTECDVNFTDKETGTTPLYRAILSNSAKTVQLLIHAKADVNMRKIGFNMEAETPLIK